MPGFNQTALANRVRNANGCSILVGDQVIGFAQNANMNIDMGAEAIYGVSSAKPQEVQQQKFGISVSLDSMELTEAGIAYYGYTSTWADLLAGNELTFHTVDASGNAIATIVGCVCNSYSKTIPVNQPVTEATSFTAMDVLDANGQSILQDAPGQLATAVAYAVTNSITGP